MDAAKFLEEKSKAKQDKKDANEEIKKKLAEAMASLTKSQALTVSICSSHHCSDTVQCRRVQKKIRRQRSKEILWTSIHL